eukprot:556444-Pyramimonas_sp.AAC.1
MSRLGSCTRDWDSCLEVGVNCFPARGFQQQAYSVFDRSAVLSLLQPFGHSLSQSLCGVSLLETTAAELATTLYYMPGAPLRSIHIYLDGSGGGSQNSAYASAETSPVPTW